MRKKILKFIALYLGIIYLLIALIPLSLLFFSKKEAPELPLGISRKSDPAFLEVGAMLAQEESINLTPKDNTVFRMYDTSTQKIISIENREFLFGSLACEMQPTVPIEALKAQTVAINSYYSRLREEQAQKDYDFIGDSLTAYPYCPKKVWLEKWGEDAEENEKKLNSAIDAVYGQLLTYENTIACTAYFQSSNGCTESAEAVWGKDFPYLQSVASPYDTLASGFESTVELAPNKIREIMETNWPMGKYNFDLPCSDWFSEITYTIGATVLSVKICGFSITGYEAKKAFGLKSPTFRVEYQGDNFVFYTKGSGNGVGMSQTGAVYMAAEGADYREILNWYYPGTSL